MTIGGTYAVLWPWTSTLPTGATTVATVPLFNAWTIWWNADRATHGFADYWDAPVFAPTHGSFAFSEPQPATLVVAPLYWYTGSLVTAYKVYLLLSLFLNGIFAYRLCRRMRLGQLAALAAGAMMVWLPLGIRQMDVLQLVPVWGILWTWDATWKLSHFPNRKNALICGIACGTCFFMSIHHGLFMMITLLPALTLSVPRRKFAQGWKFLSGALVLATLLVAPLVVPMRSIMRDHQFQRSEKLVTSLSAKPRDLLRLPEEARIGITGGQRGFQLSPGLVKCCVAAFGVLVGLSRHRRRRWTLYLSSLAVISALLALGPNLHLGTLKPWWIIADAVPGLSQVRNVFRFAYLTQMSLILLAALGLFEIRLRIQQRFARPGVAKIIAALLALICVLELPPARVTTAGVPNLAANSEWTKFLKQQCLQNSSIACLPFAPGTSVTDFDVTSRWMYYGTVHKVPLVNGYSGFFPDSYRAMRREMQKHGLTDSLLQQFTDAKVHYLVVRRNYLSPEVIAQLPLEQFELKLAISDEAGIDIYEVSRRLLRIRR